MDFINKLLGVTREDEKSIKKTTKVSYGNVAIKKRVKSLSDGQLKRTEQQIKFSFNNQS